MYKSRLKENRSVVALGTGQGPEGGISETGDFGGWWVHYLDYSHYFTGVHNAKPTELQF